MSEKPGIRMSFKTKFSLLAGIAGLIGLAAAADQYFNRTLSYTNNTSVQKVKNARSSHDQTTPSLNLWATAKPTSTPSADSLFLAHNGDLLAGGQSAGSGHNTNSVAGTSTGVASGSSNSDQSALYLAMDPGGTKFYTSDLSGALNTVSLPSGAQGTTTAITTGGNSSGTPIALAPNGNVSQAGGNSSSISDTGTVSLMAAMTAQLSTNFESAQGASYDPFTGLMTTFGAGGTGTLNQTGGNFNFDWTRGAVDGPRISLLATQYPTYFVDHSPGHDTPPSDQGTGDDMDHPNEFTDGKPPGHPGSVGAVPEPSSYLLLGAALAVMAFAMKKRVAALR